LKLNRAKFVFGVIETIFAGYQISQNGIDTDAKKVEAIMSWLAPVTVGELRSFLGLAGYYRRFIEGFAYKSAKLHDLVNSCIGPKQMTLNWLEVHQMQFNAIEGTLTTAHILTTMDSDVDFILCTDASEYAIGAVLAPRQPWRGKIVELPLGFFSRKLHDIETRYPTYDRELLAVHDSLVYWECYVQGRH
jgi:hypothetical protein